MERTKFTLNNAPSIAFPSINPAHITPEPPKHGRFFLSSMVFHGTVIALTAMIQLQPPMRETIEIEFNEAPQERLQPIALKGMPEVATLQRAAPTENKGVEKQAPAAPKAVKVSAHKAAPVAEEAPAPLDTEAFEDSLANQETAAPAPAFESEELDQELNQIQSDTAEEALASKDTFDAHAADFIDESDVTAQNLKEENLKEARAQSAAATKANHDALVKELAKGRAEQRALAARQQATAAARAAREAQARESVANARPQGQGGGGRTAVGTATTQQGRPNGSENGNVRALGELKQVPGNRRPQYDVADRMAGRQGDVTVYAYVNNAGTISKLKMPQSSGHWSLDQKTLQAIKTWKFYPGQEGWVEIPFRWDLKGGPQERPTTLRRKVSQF